MATMSYWDAKFPAKRTTPISDNERIAKWAAKIIRDKGDPQLYYAQLRAGAAPAPKPSYRVSTKPRSGNAQTFTITASKAFFDAVRAWAKKVE